MTSDTQPTGQPFSRYARRTNPSVQVEAAQLTSGADWSAIAAWCGGTLIFDHGEWTLQIPNESDATAGDWVVKMLGDPGVVLVWMADEFEFLYEPVGDGVA